MKSNILYTTSFFFPYYPGAPKYKPPISSLKQGADGVFGIGMSTAFELEDPDHHAIPCFFLEIDLNTGGVTEQSTTFPYMNLDRVQVGYDAVNKTWIAALEARAREAPHERSRMVLDLCEIAREAHCPWFRPAGFRRIRRRRQMSAPPFGSMGRDFR